MGCKGRGGDDKGNGGREGKEGRGGKGREDELLLQTFYAVIPCSPMYLNIT